VEIATGAPLPAGADAAVMVERTSREADVVLVSEPVSPWRNVGRRGNDLVAGRPVLEGGTWLTPARLGALAAAGAAAVDVFVRPRVAIASSGNELVEAGRPLGPGQIREVNRFTLPAVVRAHGGDVVPMPAIPDTLGAIRDAFDAAAGADLFIVTGGTSVGTRDLLVDVARERGDVLFHGVSMKPGMPALLAALHAPEEHQGRLAAAASAALHNRLDSAVEEALFPAGRLFLGLPGNPTSCLSVAYVLLVPLLRAVARLPEWRPMTRTLTLSAAVDSPLNRHQFYPVRVEDDRAVPAFKGSGEITSLSGADGYIEIPEGVDQIAEGTPVTVVPF
jgi:molybdenum cofactor synthesis domain-containing protein